MNNQQRQQVLEQIKSAKHVLVTVSSNPTVDELAASIGITLAINKMDKHATTVFSGVVPSTIEFLQPEKTIETTTDSLRDFIIALDKSKADKLRYKVEDDVVRIFITPYRTTITDKDLEFSQGDFNVDLVVALGVTKRQDLDKAITSHGRILHDATILAITKREMVSELGAINWQDPQASSLCEMIASVVTEIKPEVVDGQMATAFLTGIIAETDRFKNEKTTPLALSLSSQLMSAGANQQLIAEKLETPDLIPEVYREDFAASDSDHIDGELSIEHGEAIIDKIHIDDNGNLNLTEHSKEQQSKEQEFSQVSSELPLPQEPLYEELTDQQVDSETVTQEYLAPQSELATESFEEQSHQDQNPDQEKQSDVGNDLFNDLVTQESPIHEDEPTLKQPESGDSPMMQHRMVIQPPFHPDDIPKSDKPFDPEEAMKATGVFEEIQPPTPEPTPEPIPEPTPEPIPEPTPEPDKPSSVTVSTPEVQIADGDTLADLEKSVRSSHISDQNDTQASTLPVPPPELTEARDTVLQAVESQSPLFPTPSEAIGSLPINLDPPKVDTSESQVKPADPNAPPPVPPPMTPQFYDEDGNNSSPFQNPHL
jgi:hypothetical protein